MGARLAGIFSIDWVTWDGAEPGLRLVRETVYIVEQHVPVEEEWDSLDAGARHLLARDADGRPIGTARLLVRPGAVRIGRMAVLAPWRGRGVGRGLLEEALRAVDRSDAATSVLDAQLHAIPFYERFGFRAYGPEFLDAGILHRKMTRDRRRT